MEEFQNLLNSNPSPERAELTCNGSWVGNEWRHDCTVKLGIGNEAKELTLSPLSEVEVQQVQTQLQSHAKAFINQTQKAVSRTTTILGDAPDTPSPTVPDPFDQGFEGFQHSMKEEIRDIVDSVLDRLWL